MVSNRDDGEAHEKPEWWSKNEQYRERFDLPQYRPPEFSDGTPVHSVVSEVEDEYDCTVSFYRMNASYADDIRVRIDGREAFSVGRHRTNNGNTVYEHSAADFREKVRTHRTDS